MFFFFFSSRRRHTRCGRDWSSDVCSSDLPALVRRMMADLGDKTAYNRITNDSLERLMRHDWPGNVRELRNVIAVALAFGKEGPLDIAQHLAPLSSVGE